VSSAAAAIVAVPIAIDSLSEEPLVWRGSGELDPAVFFMKTMNEPSKEDAIEVEGSIRVVLPGTMFRVELDNKHMVLATICGKMRKRWVRLTAGDRVKMEMSPYDLNKARIIWRLR
jgi:translation initiation factor IF-1